MLSEDDITEILATGRTRGAGLDVIRDFLGLPPDWKPEPLSRKTRRKLFWRERKDRIRRAYQILRYGSYDGEGEW